MVTVLISEPFYLSFMISLSVYRCAKHEKFALDDFGSLGRQWKKSHSEISYLSPSSNDSVYPS